METDENNKIDKKNRTLLDCWIKSLIFYVAWKYAWDSKCKSSNAATETWVT